MWKWNQWTCCGNRALPVATATAVAARRIPQSYLARNDHQSIQWRKHFIRAYLERDVPLFGPRVPAETLERLWTMLAHGQGTLLNASQLASALMVSAPTVMRYIDLLVDLLLVRRLRPFHDNLGKRLVKSPKLYVRDSGILHALLGIPDYNALAGHPVVGASWEGFVIENLLSAVPDRTSASFFRTFRGAEMDLVLEFPRGHRFWAIEIKRGLSPGGKRISFRARGSKASAQLCRLFRHRPLPADGGCRSDQRARARGNAGGELAAGTKRARRVG